MAYDLKFDPDTQDFIDDGHGSFVLTETSETMVFHQLVCRYRAWWGLANFGSRLFDLRALQGDPKARARLEVLRALAVVVGRGRIDGLEVIAELPKVGRVVTQSRYRDISTGQLVATRVRTGVG